MTDIFTEYEKSLLSGYGHLVSQLITETDSSGTGNTVSRSSSAVHTEGKSLNFKSATVFDIYSPNVSINSNQLVLQSKNSHTQTFHSQVSSVNNWVRAQNLSVNQSGNIYHYSSDRLYQTSSRFFSQTSKSTTYADSFSLQVGQDSGESIGAASNTDYGNMLFGSTKNILFASKEGLFNVDAKEGVGISSSNSINIKGTKSVSVSSTGTTSIRATGSTSVSSIGPTTISSTSLLTLTSLGVMYLDASIIFVGIGGAGAKPSVNLDAATSVVGSATGQAVSAASSFTVSNVVGVVSNVLSGNYTGAVMGLGIIPQEIFDIIPPEAVDAALRGDFKGVLSSAVGKFGDFLGNKVSELFDVQGLISKMPGLKDIPGMEELAYNLAGSIIGTLPDFITDPIIGTYGGFTFKSYNKTKDPTGFASVDLSENLGTYSDGTVSESMSFPTAVPVEGEPEQPPSVSYIS